MTEHLPLSNNQLSKQLLTGLAASLMVIGVTTLSIAYLSLRRNLERHVQQRAQGVTQGLEFASEGLIATQDVYSIERLVQNYATLPAVLEVSIVAPDGIVLAHSDAFDLNRIQGRHYIDLHPQLSADFQEASQTGIEKNIHTVLHGKSVVVQMLPFRSLIFHELGHGSSSLTEDRGVAIAIMDLQEIEQEALQLTTSWSVFTIVSAALILLFMAVLIRRLILSPLAAINQAICQSESEPDFILPHLPNNEIQFLGTTLAMMFRQLRAYKQMELEMAEQKYAEIAKRYELATHAAKVWVWDWQIEVDCFVLDQGIQLWLGYVDGEHPHQFNTWINYIYEYDRDRFLNALHTHLEDKTPEFSCEHRLLDVDGMPHWFLSRGQAVRDQDGKVIRAIGTITDIADRKQAEAKLQQTNAELMRATRLKDEFLANMSHELRTPLNAILGMTEGLQEGVFGGINPPQLQALQTIENSGIHLLELINDILDVSKIESGQIELDCISTAVAPLCQSSVAFIKQLALKKRIQLQLKLPLNLPDLLVDERRIRQVLINLLNNAVKFTPSGGQITLEVSPVELRDVKEIDHRNANYLRIAVSDTGIGIAPENLNKLFQPFVQIDSALNRQYDGTGLGLALVKQIVELHGGQVGLSSEVGVGSCFMVDLPCASNSPLSLEITAGTQYSMIPQPDSLNPSDEKTHPFPLVLLVEDNEASLNTFSSYLGAKGYRLLLAKNGHDAIHLAKTHQPDMILMDIQMPGMDGLEALREIRRDPRLVKIPIVALTALAMTGDRDKCLAAGANHYLTKPIKLRELAATIQQMLQITG